MRMIFDGLNVSGWKWVLSPIAMQRVLVALLFLGWVGTQANAETPGELDLGEQLPPVKLRGLNGPAKALTEYRGTPLVINVWASWCGPCRAEMGSLERLAWTDSANQFQIIGISTDDYIDRAKAALAASTTTISHFIDANLVVENLLGASRIPLTVIVDAEGRVIKKVYGAREWDSPSATKLIVDALAGNSAPIK